MKPHLRRRTVDGVGKLPKMLGVARGADMGSKKTLDIAEEGIDENEYVYSGIYARELSNNRKVLTPMIAMPMDMSFSHLDGYKGKPIYIKVPSQDSYMEGYQILEDGELVTRYKEVVLWPDEVGFERPDIQETKATVLAKGLAKPEDITTITKGYSDQTNEGFYYYWDRRIELDDHDKRIRSRKQRVPRWFHGEETDMFNDWDQQRLDTIAAAIKHPFQYMPMYHYEPRRWMKEEDQYLAYTDSESKESKYPWGWDIPFSDIATGKRPGTFIGFKMYTALGYKPCDPKLPALKKFYAKCQDENIPVLCHCSPSGMCTHDIEFYYNLEKGNPTTSDYRRKLWFDRKKDWYYD